MRDKISRCFENMQIAKKKFSMHYCKHGYWIDKTIQSDPQIHEWIIEKQKVNLNNGIKNLTKKTEFATLRYHQTFKFELQLLDCSTELALQKSD